MTRTLLISFIMIFAITAHAQRSVRLGEGNVLEDETPSYFLDESFAPLVTRQNDTSLSPGAPGVQDAVGLGIDTRTTFGYTIDGRWIVGATYDRYELRTTKEVVAGVADGVLQTASHQEWGPTIGYASGGWRALFTYFVGGTQRVATRTRNYAGTTGDAVTKSKDLTGYQLTIGYTFRLTPRFELGPSLIYRAIKYHAQARVVANYPPGTYGYVNLFEANMSQALSPMITGLIRF